MSSLPKPPARVAVATSADVPQLDRDGPLLLDALADAGAIPDVVVWDDEAVDWQSYDLVLVRSTWDYHLRRDEFLSWAQRCRATSNPAGVLRWNTDKRYLLDLRDSGVPIVPTVFTEPGQLLRVPSEWTGDVVVKPAVSASAGDTGRYANGSPDAAALAATLHADGRVVMAQPYQSGIETGGETSLIYLGGEFSHAVAKGPLLTRHGTRAAAGGDATPATNTSTSATFPQFAVADAALRAVSTGSSELTYARVDLIPGDDGQPLLLELELVEPGLFLRYATAGRIAVFAEAVVRQARSRPAPNGSNGRSARPGTSR